MVLRECNCGCRATEEDDLILFSVDKRLPYGRANTCIQCDNLRKKKWKIDNKDLDDRIRKNCYTKKMYGITLEEYDDAMKTSGVCEICGSTEKLCYDHDHNTMEFRGVLCMGCNSALGHLGDNREGLVKALSYFDSRQKS